MVLVWYLKSNIIVPADAFIPYKTTEKGDTPMPKEKRPPLAPPKEGDYENDGFGMVGIKTIKSKISKFVKSNIMDTSASINKKIVGYLDQLNTSQKKTVLNVAKALAEAATETDIWEDKAFVSEIERRTTELENGTVKGYTWEEVKSITRKSLAEMKKK
jgi:hypothetical protein